jgi:hypothetical protein
MSNFKVGYRICVLIYALYKKVKREKEDRTTCGRVLIFLLLRRGSGKNVLAFICGDKLDKIRCNIGLSFYIIILIRRYNDFKIEGNHDARSYPRSLH